MLDIYSDLCEKQDICSQVTLNFLHILYTFGGIRNYHMDKDKKEAVKGENLKKKRWHNK